jgi:hypothetical protein
LGEKDLATGENDSEAKKDGSAVTKDPWDDIWGDEEERQVQYYSDVENGKKRHRDVKTNNKELFDLKMVSWIHYSCQGSTYIFIA